MPYPGKVRIVDASEEEAVMELCRELHVENGIFDLDEAKVRKMLHNAFERNGGILGAIGEPGKLQGLIYILVSSFWYSTQSHLEELFLYVKPEFRKTRNAIELMQFAKWCSAQTGFPLIIGVLSDARTEGKVRLYQRQFSKPVGNFFLYRADEAATPAATQH